jgi:hypothetical protein
VNPNILTLPLMETFQCGGLAPNILASHNLAWDALTGVLAGDPIEAWSLKVMTHTWVAHEDAPGVQFVAEFARNPEYEAEGA